MQATGAARLRELLASGAVVTAPGVYDGLTARLAARHGFPAVYVSGAATAASLGQPDMSVTGLAELAAAVRTAARASGLPVIADADTGFGGLAAIRSAARELSAAGAAAIHLEDQPFPRRCGYLVAEPPVSAAEMLARLEAARAGAGEMLVIARTELLAESLEEAIGRARAYRSAGAEIVMVNGITEVAQLERIALEVGPPLLYNVSGSDRSPRLSAADARRLGVAIMIHPIQAARAATAAAGAYLGALAAGMPAPVPLMPFREYMDLAGWADAEEFERALEAPSEGAP